MDQIEAFAFKRKHEEVCEQSIPKSPKTKIEDFRDFASPNVLVFDTETSSLRGSVIQLGWILSDPCGKVLHSYCEYWRLEDELIDPRAQEVHHISMDVLNESGVDPKKEVASFIHLCNTALENQCMIIAHNAKFDVDRINFTGKRNGCAGQLKAEDMFCTMKNSRLRCGLVKMDGKSKMPTNSELYKALFGDLPDARLHDALEDCQITLKSFVQGRMNGWW